MRFEMNGLVASSLVLGMMSATANAAPKTCAEIVTALKPLAEQCLNNSDFNARKACMDQVPAKGGVPQDQMTKCDNSPEVMTVKNGLMASEHAKYPTQPSVFNNNGGPNNGPTNTATNNGPNSGPNNGPNNGPAGKVNPAQCATVATKLKPQGDACLKVTDYNQRRACFDQAPSKAGVAQDVMNGCASGGFLDALKNSLQAQEHAKYPTQPSALNGPNGAPNGSAPNNGPTNTATNNGPSNGPNNGQNNMGPKVTPAQCAAVATKLKPQGEACIKVTDFNQRRACFDQAPSKAGVPQDLMNSCASGGFLDSLKKSLQDQEHKLYPTQQSALNGQNGAPNGSAPSHN